MNGTVDLIARKRGGKSVGKKAKPSPGRKSRADGGSVPPDVEQYFATHPPYEIDVDKEADVHRSAKAKETGGFTGRLDKLRPLSPSIDPTMETTPKEDATTDKADMLRGQRNLNDIEVKRGGRIAKGRK